MATPYLPGYLPKAGAKGGAISTQWAPGATDIVPSESKAGPPRGSGTLLRPEEALPCAKAPAEWGMFL